MKLVTHTGELSRRWDDLVAVRMIAAAGFDAFDISMDAANHPILEEGYLDHAKAVRAVAHECGIPCVQAHSPFGKIVCNEDFAHYVSLHRRAIEICHVLECETLIVHPGNNYGAAENYEKIYAKLLPEAERLGVRLATENMWNRDPITNIPYPAACGTVEDFCAHVDMAHSPHLTACVDIGHAEMPGAPGAGTLIRGLGKERVGCLHVQDVDKINDSHTLPFLGKIDWEDVIAALREIGYEGNFTYEVHKYLKGYPNELIPAALTHMETVGRYLIRRITE